MKKFIVVISIFCILASSSYADLVWSKDRGWQVQGGVLAHVIGESGNIQNALQGMNSAKEASENGNDWTALSIYEIIVKDYPQSMFAPEAYFQMGIIFTKRNQWEHANRCFETIIKKYPDYQKFNMVVGRQFEVAYLIQQGNRPYIYGIIPWFLDYGLAVKVFENVIDNAPFSDYAPMALMNISICAEKDSQPDLAIDALDRLINSYPQSMFIPDAYLQMGKIYRNMVEGPEYDQTATREAITFYQDYLILFPEESEVAHAEQGLEIMQDTIARSRLVMGDFFYYYRTDNRAAAIFYNETITLAPKSIAAEQAREMLKLIAEGVIAPMNPVDWFFGRYEKPDVDSFDMEQEKAKKLGSENFEETSVETYINENPSTESTPVLTPEVSDDGFIPETSKSN